MCKLAETVDQLKPWTPSTQGLDEKGRYRFAAGFLQTPGYDKTYSQPNLPFTFNSAMMLVKPKINIYVSVYRLLIL